MLTIKYHRKFIKEFKKLPKKIQKKLAELEDILKENYLDARLRTKKLAGKLKFKYGFRITRDYRVIFEFTSNNEVQFLNLKHRQNIYKT